MGRLRGFAGDTYESVAGFVGLVFALSTPFWVLGRLYPVQLLPGLPISGLGAFTPALGASILAYRKGRLPAVRRLLGRSFDCRRVKDKRWYLAVVLVNPTVAVLAYRILRARGEPIPRPLPLTRAVASTFTVFFIGALGEEIGWTGYATELLQRRKGVLETGMLLGTVWVAFHLVPLRQAHRSWEWIAWWSLGTISLRTIMVWFYAHAGQSVFAAALFHATINLCWQLFPVRGSFYDPTTFSLITSGLAASLLGAERLLTGRDLAVRIG